MSTSEGFKPWALDWKVEHIQRFWDWWGHNPQLTALYFSRLVGDSILDETARFIKPGGIVVDLGSGPGYMVEKLLRRNFDTIAVDLSPESIAQLAARYAGQAHFLGAHCGTADAVPVKQESADAVLVIETVEHLDDGALEVLIRNTWRLLKPGGVVIVTTPNEEVLPEHEILCPNCGCVFHTVQHMRSWTASSLTGWMESAGYRTLRCQPTLFSARPAWQRPAQKMKYQVLSQKFPHLLYIGQKPQ